VKHIVVCETTKLDEPTQPLCGGLSVESIAKSFGKRQVLHGLSLKVDRGEVVGLLGRDGAGKTITFFSILGLIGIDSGRVVLDGKDITKMPLDKRAKQGIGYLPQETSIFRGMTVSQNILAVLEQFEPLKAARQQRLEKLLEQFHIGYVRDTPARALSGGERRRCEIARAMAANPAIMLLDEPFAGIDPMSIADIRKMVIELKSHNIGILITDQNVHEMVDIVDRAYVIHEGRIVFEGSSTEMLANEHVRQVYLGAEYEA
jgi:lipopolysaccharide export system ATP-binding protein